HAHRRGEPRTGVRERGAPPRRSQGHRLHHRAGRVRRHRGAVRQREDDAARPARRAGPAVVRQGAAGRAGPGRDERGRARGVPCRQCRLRLPDVPAHPDADGAGERAGAAGAEGERPARGHGPGACAARARGPRRAAGPLPRAALGRRAAACCAGAGVRERAGRAVRGRADRQPGRRERRGGRGPARGAEPGAAHHAGVGHARSQTRGPCGARDPAGGWADRFGHRRCGRCRAARERGGRAGGQERRRRRGAREPRRCTGGRHAGRRIGRRRDAAERCGLRAGGWGGVSARFAWRMGRRELGAHRRRLVVYMAAVATGVAALVAVNSFRSGVTRAVSRDARAILGADLELRSREGFTAPIRALIDSLEAAGHETARVIRFGSMVYTTANRTAPRLLEVNALEGGYPFYGTVTTEPPDAWRTFREGRRAVVDPAVLVYLGAAVGDTLRIGDAAFEIAGVLTEYPGELGVRVAVGPRVFIPRAYVEETNLLRFGSLASHRAYFRIEDTEAVGRLVDAYEALF